MGVRVYVCMYVCVCVCVPCRHVSQLDKPSKRYRNVHADVFVIADEDDNGMYRMHVCACAFIWCCHVWAGHVMTSLWCPDGVPH